MAYVLLCNVPEIDNTYRDVMNFASKQAQITFIQNRTVINLGQVNIKYDGSIPLIDVPREYNDLLNIDYVAIQEPTTSKWTFYFVMNKEIRATNVTRLMLELDVWMTYQFELVFQTCYIERQHEYRWLSDGNPNMERLLVSEALPEFTYQTDLLDYTPTAGVFTEGNLIKTNAGTVVYTTSAPLDIYAADDDTPLPSTDYNTVTDANGNVWIIPLEKAWTSEIFGTYSSGGDHYGVDLTWETAGAIAGAPVYAVKNNMIVYSVQGGFEEDEYVEGSFGNSITLYDDATDTYHVFGHLSNSTPLFSENNIVGVDTVIGYVGNSGESTGYHLHWEVRAGSNSSNSAINPMRGSVRGRWYYRITPDGSDGT